MPPLGGSSGGAEGELDPAVQSAHAAFRSTATIYTSYQLHLHIHRRLILEAVLHRRQPCIRWANC